jgi:hypothetical protein
MNIIYTRSILCIAALSTSALATSPVPTSATPPSTPTTLGSASAPQPPTREDLEIRRLQPAAGEKFDLSEIRQGMIELLALEKEVESNQQTQVKKAALKAAIERDIKKDPKSVISLVLGFTDNRDMGGGVILHKSDVTKLFIQNDPDLAIALLDQVPIIGLGLVAESIGESWVETDPKAALAWAKQQTDSEIKDSILEGISRIMTQKDPQELFAYAEALPPGVSQDRLIKDVWRTFYWFPLRFDDGKQGVVARMQALPEGRTKELAASGISQGMAGKDLKAAIDMASGIGDTGIRTQALEKVGVRSNYYRDPGAATQSMQTLPVGPTRDLVTKGISRVMSMTDPQAAFDMASGIGDTGLRSEAEKEAAQFLCNKDLDTAIQWMQSLPVGRTKDSAACGISKWIVIAKNDPQAAMEMASGISDTGLRTQAEQFAAEKWLTKDPAAATQWINSSALPQEVKTQLIRKPPLPRPIIVPPSRRR